MSRITFIFFSILFAATQVFPVSVTSQVKRNAKEEISITSSFKPSIIKSGKLEFDAALPKKDSSSFSFGYSHQPGVFRSPLASFVVKPLSFSPDINKGNNDQFYAKLGFGNLKSPFGSIGFAQTRDKNTFTLQADHFSALGKLADQNVSNSSVLARLKHSLGENQSFEIFSGFTSDAYRLYGYDHALYSLNAELIKQNFNTIKLGAEYHQRSGENGQLSLDPYIRMDLLSASRLVSELNLQTKIPFEYIIKNGLTGFGAIQHDFVRLSEDEKRINSINLIQLPFGIRYTADKLLLSGGGNFVIQRNGFGFAPQVDFSYNFDDSNVKFRAEVNNRFEVNSLKRIYQINPFVNRPDTLNAFSVREYLAGIEWKNNTGLQLGFRTGIAGFRNLPLYVNTGISGNQFQPIAESKLSALVIRGNMNYVLNESLSIFSGFTIYSFQSQEIYAEPYGFIPIELNAKFTWKPFKGFTTDLRMNLWKGAMAQSPGKPDLRLKDVADISMSVDYKLNKKWALWIDLNNIANNPYQRWNQYPIFGFNFIGGFRYAFVNSR